MEIDIVERLRNRPVPFIATSISQWADANGINSVTMDYAADEIERLRELVAHYEKAHGQMVNLNMQKMAVKLAKIET